MDPSKIQIYLDSIPNKKPIHELIERVVRLGIDECSRRLSCHRGFVISWLPRETPKLDRFEPGWEPSGGFISGALAYLK